MVLSVCHKSTWPQIVLSVSGCLSPSRLSACMVTCAYHTYKCTGTAILCLGKTLAGFWFAGGASTCIAVTATCCWGRMRRRECMLHGIRTLACIQDPSRWSICMHVCLYECAYMYVYMCIIVDRRSAKGVHLCMCAWVHVCMYALSWDENTCLNHPTSIEVKCMCVCMYLCIVNKYTHVHIDEMQSCVGMPPALVETNQTHTQTHFSSRTHAHAYIHVYTYTDWRWVRGCSGHAGGYEQGDWSSRCHDSVYR
jgi:hypothetical protein